MKSHTCSEKSDINVMNNSDENELNKDKEKHLHTVQIYTQMMPQVCILTSIGHD